MVGTFDFEDILPKMPLPDISETFKQLEQSLRPLRYTNGLSAYSEYHNNDTNFEFLSIFANSDCGKKLQEKLKELHKDSACYLDKLHLDINNQTSTVEIRDNVLPRNPFFVLADDAIADMNQQNRAGVLCFSALKFISAFRRGLLPPDFHGNDIPVSMASYVNLFGSTRCPVFEEDINRYTNSDQINIGTNLSSDNKQYDAQILELLNDKKYQTHGITVVTDNTSQHILIISTGQYYTLEVLNEDNHLIYDESDLINVFEDILKNPQTSCNFQKSAALGSLTSYSYENWKNARKRLKKYHPNELQLIDSALFVIVLDESCNNNSEDIYGCKRLFYGTSKIDEETGFQIGSCISRWYDKLQLIITADAKAAIVWDSFTCDGSVVLRFASDIYAESVLRLAKEVQNGDPFFSLWPKVEIHRILESNSRASMYLQKIDWSFTKILYTYVHLSETKLTDLICKHDVVYHSIPFGRNFAQKLGVRPDSMIQIALQIAHYSLYGKLVFSLEPVSTRLFRNSRSEFIAIQNQPLLDLSQNFMSNSLSASEKLKRFVQVCHIHDSTVLCAQNGYGFEKHLSALKYLYTFYKHFDIDLDEEDILLASTVFDNQLVNSFLYPELIAANCGNSAITMFGITPAVPQGFGIGYIIKSDECNLTVVSQFRQGRRLMFVLSSILKEMKNYMVCDYENHHGNIGVKINPLVDKLYELDNARNLNRSPLMSTLPFIPKIIDGEYEVLHLRGCTNKKELDINHGVLRLNLSDELLEQDDTDIHSFAKRSNVISSKFDINFDRSLIGRKVKTPDQ